MTGDLTPTGSGISAREPDDGAADLPHPLLLPDAHNPFDPLLEGLVPLLLEAVALRRHLEDPEPLPTAAVAPDHPLEGLDRRLVARSPLEAEDPRLVEATTALKPPHPLLSVDRPLTQRLYRAATPATTWDTSGPIALRLTPATTTMDRVAMMMMTTGT